MGHSQDLYLSCNYVTMKSGCIQAMTQNRSTFFVGRYDGGYHKSFFLFSLGSVIFRAEIAGIEPGEFPITDAWHALPLEIPEGGSKYDIRGRFIGPLCSYMSAVEWDKSRIVNLPVYKSTHRHQEEIPKSVKVSKEFPYAVPIVTVATRYDGYYCDQRRAQAVSVFHVWVDGTAVLLELDWCEGSIEDCANPEWHLRGSPHFTIKDGLERLWDSCRNQPMWQNCSFYLYVVPPFLGSYLLGRGKRIPSNVWQLEWGYTQHAEMMEALNQIITTVWS